MIKSLLNRWTAAAAGVVVVLVPGIASADTNLTSAFSGTGQSILTSVYGVLPDVLIPFAALLAISILVRLYHKVRG